MEAVDLESGIIDFTIQARPDIVPAGIIIKYEKLVNVVEGGEDVTKEYVTEYKSSPTIYETDEGVLVFTISARGESGENITPPAGVATDYYATLSTTPYQCSFTLQEEDVTPNLVGSLINYVGYLSEWESMNAIVQNHTIQLNSGVTRIEAGVPLHLSVGDFIDLLLVGRGKVAGDSARFRARSSDITNQIPITGEETAIGAEWTEVSVVVNGESGLVAKTILMK